MRSGHPCWAAMVSKSALTSSQDRSASSSSHERISTVKCTRSGMMLRELGWFWISPTVATMLPPIFARELAHLEDHLGGRDQRVAATLHGRGADLVRLSVHVDVVPVEAEDAFGHADGLALGLEHRALLDVQLVVGMEGPGCAGQGALVADALQLLAEDHAVDVGALPRPVALELARPDPGGHHGGREP